MIKIEITDIGLDIIKDKNRVSTITFPPSYLVWAFSKNITKTKPLIIPKEENEIFYSNLEWFMNQSYIFKGVNSKYNKKTDNEFVWLSDSMFMSGTDETPRLSIRKIEDSFIINYSNPLLERNNISHGAVIAFAPAGHGQYAKNIETGNSLQDDFIMVYRSTLENRKIIEDKNVQKKLDR